MSVLYIVPTPIGNLEDITLRALRVLKEADFILAEDTRTSKKLLSHFEIENQVFSYHQHNEHKSIDGVVSRLKTVKSVALISDAGTPGISDPGFLLIRECLNSGIEVVCLPGATALIPALVGSGFPSDRFCFEGFLPHKKGRQSKWKALADEQRTIVLYESPYRLVKALKEIELYFGNNREVCVVRELSKIYEEFKRGTAADLIKHFENKNPKGEIVVLIAPPSKKSNDDE